MVVAQGFVFFLDPFSSPLYYQAKTSILAIVLLLG
jgi:hypothetical protein